MAASDTAQPTAAKPSTPGIKVLSERRRLTAGATVVEVEPEAAKGVALHPVTPDNVRQVCDLRVAPAQEWFVSSAAVSLAEAYVHPRAWCRAVHTAADGIVGFVMLHDTADGPGYMLWRLLIDERYQGRGHGREAVVQVADYVRTRPAAVALKVSARRGEGSPRRFYESLGFAATGEVIDGDEDVFSLDLRTFAGEDRQPIAVYRPSLEPTCGLWLGLAVMVCRLGTCAGA